MKPLYVLLPISLALSLLAIGLVVSFMVPPGKTITDAHLDERTFLPEEVPEGVIRRRESLVLRTARVKVAAGKPILASDVYPPGENPPEVDALNPPNAKPPEPRPK